MSANLKASPMGRPEIGTNSNLRIKMAFAEARLECHDIHYICLSEECGSLGLLLEDWLNTTDNDYAGKMTMTHRESASHISLKERAISVKVISDEIKSKDFSEILLVGGEIAIFKVSDEIFFQKGKVFADFGGKIHRSLLRVTSLLKEIQENENA